MPVKEDLLRSVVHELESGLAPDVESGCGPDHIQITVHDIGVTIGDDNLGWSVGALYVLLCGKDLHNFSTGPLRERMAVHRYEAALMGHSHVEWLALALGLALSDPRPRGEELAHVMLATWAYRQFKLRADPDQGLGDHTEAASWVVEQVMRAVGRYNARMVLERLLDELSGEHGEDPSIYVALLPYLGEEASRSVAVMYGVSKDRPVTEYLSDLLEQRPDMKITQLVAAWVDSHKSTYSREFMAGAILLFWARWWTEQSGPMTREGLASTAVQCLDDFGLLVS